MCFPFPAHPFSLPLVVVISIPLRLRVCLFPCALWEWRDESSIVFPALPSLQGLTRGSTFPEETDLEALELLMSQCFFELNKAHLKPKERKESSKGEKKTWACKVG